MKKRLAMFILVLGMMIIPAAALSKTYDLVVPMVEGLSMGSLPKLLQDLGNVIEKKTGIALKVKDFSYKKGENVSAHIVKMFDEDNVDFSFIYGKEYVKYKQMGGKNAIPFVTLTVFNKTSLDICMYTRKSDNITEPKTLKGKRWGGTHSVPTRYLFYKKGIDKPLHKFFGSQKYIDDTKVTDLMDALLDNRIDVFVINAFQIKMSKGSDKKYRAVQASNCMEYEHTWVFVHHKDIPKDVIKKLTKTLMRAHKDSDFAQFRFILTAIKGKFVPFDPEKLKTTEKIVKLVQKKGWDKEEKKYIKANADK